MMKKLFFAFLLGLLLFSSCRNEEKRKILPSSKGLPYELLLVVDEDIWKSSAGDSLKAILEGSVPGLPQHEPMFRLLKVFPENYVQMYTTIRNTLFVSLDSTLKTPQMSVAYNVKAKPQIYVSVKAPDIASLEEALYLKKENLTDYFVEMELNLERDRLKKKYHKEISLTTERIFGYKICVPDEMRSWKEGEQFLWASTELIDKDLNFVMYTFPYQESDDFSDINFWVAKRDSAMKRNIPGSQPDQWMTTTWEQDMPIAMLRDRKIDEQDAWEVRGLWELRNGGIGGPFVSLARVDSADRKVVVCEGFIYSPRTEKRNLMRRMEASLRTLEKLKK